MKLGAPDESGRRKPIRWTAPTLPSRRTWSSLPHRSRNQHLLPDGKGPESTDPGQQDLGWTRLPAKQTGRASSPAATVSPDQPRSLEALDMGNRRRPEYRTLISRENPMNRKMCSPRIDTALHKRQWFSPTHRRSGVQTLRNRRGWADFREVEPGFSPERSMEEARRCLRCYRLMVWEVDKTKQEQQKGGRNDFASISMAVTVEAREGATILTRSR